MTCYWPEVHRYYGCCSLRIGIFIRSVLGLGLTAFGLVSNVALLIFMFQISEYLHFADLEDFENKLNSSLTEDERHTMTRAHKIVIAYLISWIALKVIYVVTIVLSFYALFKGKPTILKWYLYINVPNWIYDILVTTVIVIMCNFWFKFLVLFCLLSEGYNLLAINTAYKKMTGKSRLVPEEDMASIETEAVVHPNGFITSPPYSWLRTQSNNMEYPHCRTCTCNLSPVLANIPSVPTMPVCGTSVESEVSPAEDNKVLNFKEEPIVFDQHQLVERDNSIVERGETMNGIDNSNSVTNRNIRPTNLALKVLDTIDGKRDLADVPVIYDEQQLNVGTSPIIEDRNTSSVQYDSSSDSTSVQLSTF